jgi:hypothetical protein
MPSNRPLDPPLRGVLQERVALKPQAQPVARPRLFSGRRHPEQDAGGRAPQHRDLTGVCAAS